MKKLLLSVISILALVIGSLFFCSAPVEKNKVLAEQNNVAVSHYLVNGETPYFSNKEVGECVGYGEVPLGESTTLYAKAYEGFKLVGWQIEFKLNEQDETYQKRFINKTGVTIEESENLSPEQNPYYEFLLNVQFNNESYDGSLLINQAFKDLIVNPVFDFADYYKFELTNLCGVLNGELYSIIDGLNPLNDLTLNENVKFYYTDENGGEYTNTIVQENGKFYFYGKTKNVDGKLYSVHQTLEDNPQEQLIELTLDERTNGSFVFGAVRLDENVDLSFKIKHKEFDDNYLTNENNTINYDISSATLNCDAGKLNLDVNQSNPENKTAEGVTKAIDLSFNFNFNDGCNFALDKDKILQLDFNCERLFYIEFEPNLVDIDLNLEQENNEARTLILQQMQVINSYYQFLEQDGQPSYKYLVKNAEDNYGIVAHIVYPQVVYFEESTGERYNYYEFVSASLTDISSISRDTKIEVNYSTYKYYVNFQFALQTDNGLSLLSDKNVEAKIPLGRGMQPTDDISKTDQSNNVGFTFVGFTTELNKNDFKETISKSEITIDKTHPKDIVIYMVFKYTEYTIKITGLKNNVLKNGDVEIYPFSYVNIYKPENSTNEVNERITDFKQDVEFTHKFILVDEFSLSFRINAGFNLLTFAGQTINTNTIKFSMSDLVLETTQNDTIEFKAEFAYVEYSLDYFINASEVSGSKIFMADISLELPSDVTGEETTTINPKESTETEYGRIKVLVTSEQEKVTIHLSGLHLYDNVKLIATANAKDGGDVKYRLNRFYENGMNYLYAQSETDKYYVNYAILRDAFVEVSFVEPTTILEIVTNLNAISFANIDVYSGDKKVDFSDSGQITIATGTTKVEFYTFGHGNGRAMNFGYQFSSAELDNGEITTQTSGDKISIEFSLNSQEKYTLTLKFTENEYKIKIKQTNSDSNAHEDWQDSFVKFNADESEQEYTSLTVSKLELNFNMPNGYYANRLYLENKLQLNNLQTNDAVGNEFSCLLSVANLQAIAADKNGGDEIELTIEYTIHTYALTISFRINSDRPNYDDAVLAILPNIEIDELQQQPQRINHSYVYSNIPYNTQLTINVSDNILGLAKEGWFDKFGAALSQDQLVDGNLKITLKNNEEYMYSLVYISYNIRIKKVVEDNVEAGNPYSIVNNTISQQVRLFDNLVIYSNAIRENGYTYDYIAYNINETEQNKVYRDHIEFNHFLLDMFVNETEDSNGYIEFYVAYKQLDITITMSKDVNSDYLQEFENELGFVNATFSYLKYDANAQGDAENSIPPHYSLDNPENSRHYRDIVQIGINFIQVLGSDYGLEAGLIDFENGVSLKIYINGEANPIEFIQNDLYDLYVSFNLNGKLKYLNENNELNIVFSYTILEKQLTYTTNVSDPNFYSETQPIYFILTVETDGNPKTYESLPKDGDFTTSSTFLTHASLRYNMNQNNFTQNLIVASINAYIQVKTDVGFNWELVDLLNIGAQIHDLNGNGRLDFETEYISYYYMGNVKIELVVQPIIEDSAFHSTMLYGETLYRHELDTQQFEGEKVHKFFGDYLFYNPNETGLLLGYHQLGLTIGESLDSNINIELNSYFAKYVKLKYYKITDGLKILDENEIDLEQLIDVGQYLVSLTVCDASDDDPAPLWLKQMGFGSYHIILEVRPVTLFVEYNGSQYTKEYNGPTGYRISEEDFRSKILPYLVFSAENCLNINSDGTILDRRIKISVNYSLNSTINPQFSNQENMKPIARISTVDEFDFRQPYEASEKPYNILLQNLNLIGNKNFVVNKEAVLQNAAIIKYKEISLQNLHFRDKVYDGTDSVSLDNRYRCFINENDIMDSYDSSINLNELIIAKFGGENASEIGENKPIIITQANLNNILNYLFGSDIAKNYILKLANTSLTASIYPDKISTYIDGYGTISLVNEIGKTNPNKVSLIPFDTTLLVETIKIDSSGYNRIYRYIAGSLNNKTFVVGYRIKMVSNGATSFVPNELQLQLPTSKGINGLLHLSNDNSLLNINYKIDGNIQIDLQQLSQPNMFIIIKNKAMLTWWQILLIVLFVLIIIAIIVTLIVVKRIKSLRKFKQNEKI